MRGLEQIPWLYDPVCALYERLALDRWRRWLVAGARGLALDVGCGTGRNLPLYREGVRVVGLDPAWASLQRARRRVPHIALVQGSAEALPFSDATFDTVVSGLTFCSVRTEDTADLGEPAPRVRDAAEGEAAHLLQRPAPRVRDAAEGEAAHLLQRARAAVRRVLRP